MAPLDTTLRQQPPPDQPASEPWSGWFDEDKPPVGSTIVQTDEDGGVTVKVVEDEKPERDERFDENLAELEELSSSLGVIAEDLLEGVEADIRSREEFTENLTRGMELLGLVIETQSRTKGQRRKTSSVRDTTLLESVVKAQSQARGELLPASGPAKIETVAQASSDDEQMASDFEDDFNNGLTLGMPEYVPDLDRGLFGFFFGGNMFRYGYHCPIKGRPRVDTVAVEDLIVSEAATDLDTATRWTIRVPRMEAGEVRRKQRYGVWRDCDLGVPMPESDSATQKKAQIAGVSLQGNVRPRDLPFTIYQTVTDLDLGEFGFKEKGAEEGFPLPYRVTVEKHSRQILRIERFWKEGDGTFARKRRCVHYAMVPGFGFLAYGFLHLQGNQVSTLTAVVRLLVDAMMFGTFPGGVKIKGQRSETNEIEPGPGEFAELGVPAGVDDIRKVIMALPYKDLSPVSIQLYELVQQACARVGAAAMLEVGEGRAQMPVGTIMAMLEEKSVVMGAVHKRLHEAMGQELRMIRELFAERPESWKRVLPSPKRDWAAMAETANLDLVPASDPNVPSQVHRVMMATALATLMSMPVLQGKLDIDDGLKRVLRMIGISDVDSLVVPSQPQGDPNAAMAQATLQAKAMDVQQKQQDSQRKAASEVVKAQQQERESQRRSQTDGMKAQVDMAKAEASEETERMRMAVEELRSRRQDAAAMQEHNDQMANAASDRLVQQQRGFGGQGI